MVLIHHWVGPVAHGNLHRKGQDIGYICVHTLNVLAGVARGVVVGVVVVQEVGGYLLGNRGVEYRNKIKECNAI